MVLKESDTVSDFHFLFFMKFGASLIAQLEKSLPAVEETPVRLLGREDLLEKG